MLAVLHASQVVTLAGPKRPRTRAELSELSIISDGGMLIDEGKIVVTGKSAEIEKQISSETEVVEATGKTVFPGFVDAHTHPVFGGNRLALVQPLNSQNGLGFTKKNLSK